MSADQSIMPSKKSWHELDNNTIAAWTQQRGGATVIVVDGTRRWYQFTHLKGGPLPESAADYMAAGATAHAALIELLLAHGLTPLFVPLIIPFERGERYAVQMLKHGVPSLLNHPRLRRLLAGVRVRFYGAWPTLPADWSEARQELDSLREFFVALEQATRLSAGPALFLRLYTNSEDPQQELVAAVARLSNLLGRVPTRAELLRELYQLDASEDLSPIKLFLSSELHVSGFMPPLLGGQEAVYFTTDSLLALDQVALREALYDFVFLRYGLPGTTTNELNLYDSLTPEQRATTAAWHAARRGAVIGVGARHVAGGFWYPLLGDEAPGGLSGA